MQKLAEEKERMAQKKELEVARLRILQERIQDKRSAQDEERAKRYQVCLVHWGLNIFSQQFLSP